MPLNGARWIAAWAAISLAGCYEARAPLVGASASCDQGCHGGAASLAPPPGVWLEDGATGTDQRGVGAHQAHLAAGSLSGAVPCDTCHVVPDAVDAPGHMDSPLPAELTFGGLATSGGARASWDGKTCAVYCHGPSASAGGSVPAPSWTTVDGSQAACGACHGLPPGGTHPAVSECHLCHDQVVDSANTIIAPTLHVDGKVQVRGTNACNACHGSAANAAPPLDTLGNSDPTTRGVGAHQIHVRAGPTHGALDCDACHVKPADVTAAGHMDSALPAEVTFGALARTGGLQPGWDSSALTCGQTYCHAGVEGGGLPAPSWSSGQKMVCGSCHGLPPAKTRSGGNHPAASLSACANCHPAVVDAAGQIVDPAKHVNGKVDLN